MNTVETMDESQNHVLFNTELVENVYVKVPNNTVGQSGTSVEILGLIKLNMSQLLKCQHLHFEILKVGLKCCFGMEHYFLSATLQHLTSVPCGWFPSWRNGEWNACSVTCGGGSQVRRVECISHDSAGPRVVKDAVCAAYAEAPPSLQTCNMHKCAEYRVARWSAVSFNFQMDMMGVS